MSWRLRTFRSVTRVPQLGFGVCSAFTEVTQQAFSSWLLLRHHERQDFKEYADAVSVGVLLTPRTDGLRDWDTTMAAVTGDPEPCHEKRRRNLWYRKRCHLCHLGKSVD